MGTFEPNDLGIYNTVGNVWEWCHDWDGPYDDEATLTDPWGPEGGDYSVLRGGSFNDAAGDSRSAYRDGNYPDGRNYNVGFRVARTYP